MRRLSSAHRLTIGAGALVALAGPIALEASPAGAAPLAGRLSATAPPSGVTLSGALRLEVVRLHRQARHLAAEAVLPGPPALRLARRPDRLRAQVRRLRAFSAGVVRAGGRVGVSVASAYSASDAGAEQGCPGAPRLDDHHLSVATFLVPCDGRLRLCYGTRCVSVVRRDSGPYVGGRTLDLNLGVVRALGFDSLYSWGVRGVRYREIPSRVSLSR